MGRNQTWTTFKKKLMIKMQKSTALIVRDNYGFYDVISSNNKHLSILADFLATEIRACGSAEFIYSWLKSAVPKGKTSKIKGISGNLFSLDNIRDQILIRYTSVDYSDNRSYFKTSKENLMCLLVRWAELTDQEKAPPQIIITQENDNISIMPSVQSKVLVES